MTASTASRFIARAPSNIALIKYMGKVDARANLPANPSLSLTLRDLATFTELRRASDGAPSARWTGEAPDVVPPAGREARVPRLDAEGAARVERHFGRAVEQLPAILARHGLGARTEGAYEIRSFNTFPAATGIASSASSFAALTLATARAFAADLDAFDRVFAANPELRRDLAALSRQGSGSSCRSFEGPWVLWSGERAAAMRTGMPVLADLVLLIGREPKAVSSSEAHRRVSTSPLWDGRMERVAHRIASLEAALAEGSLREVSRIVWSESWEMHSLFHTAAEPFTYWEPGSVAALRWLGEFVARGFGPDGEAPPIVTMDAGPNVHVLVPRAEAPAWRRSLAARFPELAVLEDAQGAGAEPVLA
jgi:diphosphomevalonate decarboxylase